MGAEVAKFLCIKAILPSCRYAYTYRRFPLLGRTYTVATLAGKARGVEHYKQAEQVQAAGLSDCCYFQFWQEGAFGICLKGAVS